MKQCLAVLRFLPPSTSAGACENAEKPTHTHTCRPTLATRWWIAGPPAIALLIISACTESATDGPVATDLTLRSEWSIYGGKQDDDVQAIPGVVALKVVQSNSKFELCSGALLAPNVVLTARHCVAVATTTAVSCDENGQSTNGAHVSGNQPPDRVSIYVGASPSFGAEPAAMARAIVSPRVNHLCDNDLAIVVLDREIRDVEPVPVRMAGSIYQGETIRSVGYGQNDRSMPIGTRIRRENVRVLALGKGVSESDTALGPHEFEVGRSICQGDSGGPAISEETGAVVGVVSRGGECTDNFGHIYVTTSGFDAVFAEAFALAGTQPIVESGMTGAQRGPGPQARAITAPIETPKAGGAQGGCTAASGSSSTGAFAFALVFAAACRRRRPRP